MSDSAIGFLAYAMMAAFIAITSYGITSRWDVVVQSLGL